MLGLLSISLKRGIREFSQVYRGRILSISSTIVEIGILIGLDTYILMFYPIDIPDSKVIPGILRGITY